MRLQEMLESRWGAQLKRLWISERPREVAIAMIVLRPEARGRGVGREIMSEIARYADVTGRVVLLSPEPTDGSTKAGLLRFYKSFGFVENKGRAKRFEYRDTMYRDPR